MALASFALLFSTRRFYVAAAIVVRSAESLLFYDPLGCCCCCCCCWFCCCCCCSRRFSFRFFSPSDPSPLPTTKVRNQSCGRKINAADQKTTTTTTTTTIAKKKRQQKSQTRSFGFSFFCFFFVDFSARRVGLAAFFLALNRRPPSSSSHLHAQCVRYK